MRRKNEIRIKDAIEEYLKKSKLKPKLDEVKLREAWEGHMGKAIANYTNKIYLKDRKLFINLSSSVLRDQLSYSKSKIIEMLNREVGEEIIDEVILK
ncbi:DUF721 domain-containing protein [Candidatus Amoebophilus asiaticus]|nr:DUF721 domain-containing protein [Candidatus Amoebophilus asiaticus]